MEEPCHTMGYAHADHFQPTRKRLHEQWRHTPCYAGLMPVLCHVHQHNYRVVVTPAGLSGHCRFIGVWHYVDGYGGHYHVTIAINKINTTTSATLVLVGDGVCQHHEHPIRILRYATVALLPQKWLLCYMVNQWSLENYIESVIVINIMVTTMTLQAASSFTPRWLSLLFVLSRQCWFGRWFVNAYH